MNPMPDNFVSLHYQEELLRAKALQFIAENARLALHLTAVEATMNIGDLFRQYETSDEDLKLIQLLGMRIFNAFGASLKLALSGYFQNSALVMRDILETAFLIDLFHGDRGLIEKWRIADKRARFKDFSPVKVRTALDDRDGFTSKKRAEVYDMFSDLAAHPTMSSSLMMRPQKGADAVIGPFMEKTSLEATLSEMGRLAVQAGQHLVGFYPKQWGPGLGPRITFLDISQRWVATFYSQDGKP